MLKSPGPQVNNKTLQKRFVPQQFSPQAPQGSYPGYGSSQGYPGQGYPGQGSNIFTQRSPGQGGFQPSPQSQIAGSPNPGIIRQSPTSGIVQLGQTPLSQTINLGTPSQSLIQSVERIEQPLQVVDLYQVEEPWRQRVAQLEQEIARLRSQPQEKTVVVSDDGKANEIEKELSQAYAQIQQLINTIKILQEENLNFSKHNDEKRRRIEQLEAELRAKEQELADLQAQIDDLNAQLDDLQGEQEEKSAYLMKEVNVWKQKFIDLNKEFHTTQEALMLAQAELDNIKHQSVQVVGQTTTTTTKKSRG